jgi:hypothetical protein
LWHYFLTQKKIESYKYLIHNFNLRLLQVWIRSWKRGKAMAVKMKKVLGCIFVFVILMSVMSISVFAMDDNKTKDNSVNFISNYQNETVRILANSDKKIILPVPYYSQGYTYWCALTSISMLANYLRRTNVYHPWDIAEALDKDKWDGLRRNWLISYFDEASRVVTDIEPSVEIKKWKKEKSDEALQYILDMIEQDQPVILGLWGEKHVIVVVGYELDQNNPDNPWIFIHDPDQVLNSVLKNYHLELPLITERVKWSDIANLMAGLLEEDVTYTAKMPNPNLKDQYMPSGTINLEDGSVNILGEDGGIILFFDEGLQWKADNRPLYVVSPIGMRIHFYIANQYEVEKSYKVLITMDDQVLTSDHVSVKKRNWTACSYTYPFLDISSGEHTLSIGVWETLQEYPHLIPCDLVDFPLSK